MRRSTLSPPFVSKMPAGGYVTGTLFAAVAILTFLIDIPVPSYVLVVVRFLLLTAWLLHLLT